MKRHLSLNGRNISPSSPFGTFSPHAGRRDLNLAPTQEEGISLKIFHHTFTSLPSTQEEAKNNRAQLNPNEWHIYTADEQTQGRATQGKQWQSPPDVNIYATFSLLIPKHFLETTRCLPLIVAYALVKTIQSQGLYPKIKWPNDLLLNKKKLAGILCETMASPQHANYRALFIGIGINLNMPTDISNEINQPMTSLYLATGGKKFDKKTILDLLEMELHQTLDRFFSKGFSPFFTEINLLMEFVNEKVNLILPKENSTALQGIFKGIDEAGELMIELPNGKIDHFPEGRLFISSTQ